MNDALKEFTETVRLKKDLMIAEAMRGNQESGSSAIFDPITRCVELLTEFVPDLDDDRYFRVVELLWDKELQRALISMLKERRLALDFTSLGGC